MSDDYKSNEPARQKAGFFRRVFLGYEDAPDTEATPAKAAEHNEISSPEDVEAILDVPVVGAAPIAAVHDARIQDAGLHAAASATASIKDAETLVTMGERADPIPAVAPEPPAPIVTAEQDFAKRSWWSRLRDGLARSSSSIGTGISDIFTKRKLDATMLEDLEDVLIRADLGVATATRICDAVGKGRYDRDVSPDDVKTILADEVERVLAPYAKPLQMTSVETARPPFVILVVGVNGSGKTTTIGKLAAKFTGEGKVVALAAGDTFRAAAIAQLRIWGERFGCQVIAREQGSDAAGLAYEAIETARASGADILLMDTAGRLQNRAELMAELTKIIKVMRKLDAAAPHAVLLVLDATVGQNAMSQVEIFGKVAGVTGLVMTKLDGTARGGILVAITEAFKLPVHFIGVGETAEDLEPFAARDFAEAIAGVEHGTARE